MRSSPGLDDLYAASYRRLAVQLYAVCGDFSAAEDAVQVAFVTCLRRHRQLQSVANEAIVAAAARRDRRSAVAKGIVAATAVVLVICGVVAVRGLDLAGPEPVRPPTTSDSSPTPTPSEAPKSPEPTGPRSLDSMTPEEVVTAPDAVLETVAIAPGDPDIRISMWRALCHWCPDRPDGRGGVLGPPTFTGMALTTDGYETATYVRHPFSYLAPVVRSPRDDIFLVIDTSNGREWLVDLDGTVRRVARVASELRPTDPRLWFECALAGGVSGTWCSLDPDAATAYAWPEPWSGSAMSPGSAVSANSGVEPWGWSWASTGTFEDPGGEIHAWWDDNGVRQSRVLGTDVVGGGVLGSPAGELAYWTWRPGSDTVDLHAGRNRGAAWDVDTRAAPDFNRWVQMTRSPDGAQLAWTTYPHLVVWRAEAAGGGFRQVYEASGPETAGAGLWTQDDVVYASGSATAAVSEDGGLTWATIESWR